MTALTELTRAAKDGARDVLNGVEVLSKVLADQMRDAHGGEWRINIDRDATPFILIRQLQS